MRRMFYFSFSLLFFAQNLFANIGAIEINEILPEKKNGLFFGDKNFSIHASNTQWFQVSAPEITSPHVKVEYRSTEEEHPGRLTLRVDQTKKKYKLYQYLKKSIKDYKRFGFHILEARPVEINHMDSFVIDLKQKVSDVQTRQIFFKKADTVVILTCTGHKTSFQTHLKACNQIARNFQWTE